MTTRPKPVAGDASMLEVLRMLVLLQAAIFVTTAIESMVAIAFGGPALIPLVGLNILVAAIMLASARGARRGSRRARRTIFVIEVVVLLLFAADSVIAILITSAGLGLVPTLTRFLLPATIIWTLNRGVVKPYFSRDLPDAPAPSAPPAPPEDYSGVLVWSSA